MIRELRKADINKVANIWLDTNITAHYFIPAQYWQNNFELVKELLLQATVYVLAPGENRHFEPGENSQFQPGRNRQSVPGGCSQPRFGYRF